MSDGAPEMPTVREVLERAAQRAECATGSAVDVLAAARAERDDQLLAAVTSREDRRTRDGT